MTELILHADFELRSHVAPKDVGSYEYLRHPTTEFLFLSYAFGDEPVEYWKIYLGDRIPSRVEAAIKDPRYMVSAFNSFFERHGFAVLGYEIPIDRFEDPQIGGRYLSLPSNLEDQGDALGLPPHLTKDPRGAALIKLFCNTRKTTKKNPNPGYNDWISHPKEWEEFLEYGGRDIIAERELIRRQKILGALPLPPFEQKLWIFDQKVNDRGVPTDRVFVEKMYKLAKRSKQEALEAQNKITGLENANSRDQVLPWLKARGYPFSTLRKETVDSVLKDPEVTLTDEARDVLRRRREASSTTYTKLPSILNHISADGNLRGMFSFLGSPRCGRWSGNGVQLHNMARPGIVGQVLDADGKEIHPGYDFEDTEVLREARNMVLAEDYDGIKDKYKSVLLVIKNLIRTVFTAEGSR